MRICIKTAHGYLSFQPPPPNSNVVRLEYRPVCGPWENRELDGFVLDTPGPNAPSDPVEPPPAPITPPGLVPTRSAAYVAAVKAWLIDQGVNLTGPCGAFAITRRVAWGLRDQGAGLLSKPAGNNCEGYATDIVMFHDAGGDIIDILGDGGHANTPMWSVTDRVDLARWRPAVAP